MSAPASQEVISQRKNPSAPAFRRGTATSPAKRAAPAPTPPPEPEEDNPYALFMAGDNEAVDEVGLLDVIADQRSCWSARLPELSTIAGETELRSGDLQDRDRLLANC
jgi:hypothetical protein